MINVINTKSIVLYSSMNKIYKSVLYRRHRSVIQEYYMCNTSIQAKQDN